MLKILDRWWYKKQIRSKIYLIAPGVWIRAGQVNRIRKETVRQKLLSQVNGRVEKAFDKK